MNGFRSALYSGRVMHHRLRPRQHRLRYSIFYLLIDLDEADGMAKTLRLFSRNRFNLFSFRDRDHGDGSSMPLRAQIDGHLREANVDAGGPIRLLTMPRILGYAFNPLSVYFCYRRDESLAAIIYEVSNTFGQRHSYLVPVAPGAALPIRQQSRKSLYVSPFMTTDMDYSFVVVPPNDRVAISITGSDAQGPLIIAKLSAVRRALTDAALLKLFVSFPLLTLKVIVGIHWEALLLWFKGVGLQHRPPPPGRPMTIGHANDQS